jgi:polygalacturonase
MTAMKTTPKKSASHKSSIEQLEIRRMMAHLPATAGVFNVVNYGARPNDGVDDTAAINRAFDAMGNSSSQVLYLPDGVYDISGTLRASMV